MRKFALNEFQKRSWTRIIVTKGAKMMLVVRDDVQQVIEAYETAGGAQIGRTARRDGSGEIEIATFPKRDQGAGASAARPSATAAFT